MLITLTVGVKDKFEMFMLWNCVTQESLFLKIEFTVESFVYFSKSCLKGEKRVDVLDSIKRKLFPKLFSVNN